MGFFDHNLAQKCVKCCKVRYCRSGRVVGSCRRRVLHSENSTHAILFCLIICWACETHKCVECWVQHNENSKKSVTRYSVFGSRYSGFGTRDSVLGIYLPITSLTNAWNVLRYNTVGSSGRVVIVVVVGSGHRRVQHNENSAHALYYWFVCWACAIRIYKKN